MSPTGAARRSSCGDALGAGECDTGKGRRGRSGPGRCPCSTVPRSPSTLDAEDIARRSRRARIPRKEAGTMKHDKVGKVMTSEVVRAVDTTPFKEVARLLAQHRISGLPVVDDDDKVIGVISETDLMAHRSKVGRGRSHPWRASVVLDHRQGTHAGDQGARPRCRGADDTPRHHRSRRPVHRRGGRDHVRYGSTLPGGRRSRLVGIVTRRDLLEVFLRPDAEIRREVIDEALVRSLGQPPEAVRADVKDGVVTVVGQLERRSEVPIALRMVGQVMGDLRRRSAGLPHRRLRRRALGTRHARPHP